MLASVARTARASSWSMPLLGAPTPFAAIDSNGNLTQKVDGSVTTTYTWDAENRLLQVQNNGSTVASFSYDALGRRVQKVAGGVTTTWTYHGAAILRQVIGASTLKYIHGPGIDEPLASDDGSALSYFHADGLGSITKTTSAAGAVTLTRQYDAWGNLQAGGTTAGFAFTGREHDPETGLAYYRARYYDPKVGRFVSEDPIGVDGGINLYAYVENNPVMRIDPFGKDWKDSYEEVRRTGFVFDPVGPAREASRIFPNTPGRTRDKQRHCFYACIQIRRDGPMFSWWLPSDVVRKFFQVLGGTRSVGEAATDIGSDAYGMMNYLNLSKTCAEICTTCPFNREGEE